MPTTTTQTVNCGCCAGELCDACGGITTGTGSIENPLPRDLHATFYGRGWVCSSGGIYFPYLDGFGPPTGQYIVKVVLFAPPATGSYEAIPTPPLYDPYFVLNTEFQGFIEPSPPRLLQYHPSWVVRTPAPPHTQIKTGAWIHQSFDEAGYFCVVTEFYCYEGKFRCVIWYLTDASGLVLTDTGTGTGSGDGDPTAGVAAVLYSILDPDAQTGWVSAGDVPTYYGGYGAFTEYGNSCSPPLLYFGSLDQTGVPPVENNYINGSPYPVPTGPYSARFQNAVGANPSLGPDQTASGNIPFAGATRSPVTGLLVLISL